MVQQAAGLAFRIPTCGPVAVQATESRIRTSDLAVAINLVQGTVPVEGQLVPAPATALLKANLTTFWTWAASLVLDPAVAPDPAVVPEAQPVTSFATNLGRDPEVIVLALVPGIDRESDNPEIDPAHDPVIVRAHDQGTVRAHDPVNDRWAVARVALRKTTGTNARPFVTLVRLTSAPVFARIRRACRAGTPDSGEAIPIGAGAGGDITSTGGVGEPGQRWPPGAHGAGHNLVTGTGA